jgi:DNA-binding transcriptional regulator YhcF (GntR family)
MLRLVAELAGDLGVSPLVIREALVELRDEGFFPGKPSFSTKQFHGRLPA